MQLKIHPSIQLSIFCTCSVKFRVVDKQLCTLMLKLMVNLESQINLHCMFLNNGRKLDNTERTHTSQLQITTIKIHVFMMCIITCPWGSLVKFLEGLILIIWLFVISDLELSAVHESAWTSNNIKVTGEMNNTDYFQFTMHCSVGKAWIWHSCGRYSDTCLSIYVVTT